MIQQAASPLFPWPNALIELGGFLSSFLSLGALGFRFGVLRPLVPHASAPLAAVYDTSARRAAWIGLLGGILGALDLVADLAQTAAERHLSMAQAWTRGGGMLVAEVVLLAFIIVTFALAAAGRRGAWSAALVATIAFTLRDIVSLHWKPMINPLHRLGGSLWIGTLFALFVAGVPTVMRSTLPREQRGRAVADLVAMFSPLALAAAGLLVTMGVITAWLHLKYPAALWTTSYGRTLILKLIFVAIVAGLGAWNWRRMRPALGDERGAIAIQRSARAELSVAGIILLITAVLVSLPTPKLPK